MIAVENGPYGPPALFLRFATIPSQVGPGVRIRLAPFALYPTQMSDLMAVADAGAIMPPKSTWFEPKLADGMVSHLLD